MNDFRRRLGRLAPYFKDSRMAWAVAVFASLFIAATEPLAAWAMGPLIDKGFHSRELPLWWIPPIVIGIFVVRGAATFTANYTLSWAANKGVLSLREAMFAHVLRAQPCLFSQQNASSLTNTIVYEVQTGALMLINGINSLARDSLTLVGLLGYLLWLNWRLTLMIAVLMPAVGWIMNLTGKRLRRLAIEGQRATDQLAYVVEENVLAWRIVRLHGAAAEEAQRFGRSSNLLRRLLLKSMAASAAITPVTQIIIAVAMSAVIVMALWQSRMQQTSTVGDFVSFITAMLMIISPVKYLSDVLNPITRGLAALERGLDLIEQTPVETGGTHGVARARGDLRLTHVNLRYTSEQSLVLDGVNLDLPAGQTVALVGPSGAGKSSLVHLLPRFIEPTSGTITLDGVPLAQWQLDSLRSQFAMVTQDVVLFNDSVAENVALGQPVDAARVRQALRDANLLEFVESLPQGIDSLVGHNGSQLSGGQRQRLAIARAVYKNAPVLILDEATSALDTESERLVQQALDRLMRKRSTIVIAHRLTTIERADRIVVMNGGRIVEQGTHHELLGANGLYARLHAMQFRA